MSTNTNNVYTFLSLLIDKEYFAVNVEKVLEVLQMQKINRVPNVSSDIKGVTNFRGEIIPVFDTRVRFSLPELTETDKNVIVVLDISSNENKIIIGAIVDKVKDVFIINDNEILPVPKMKIMVKNDYISGVYKLKNDFIMLLDVDKVFSNNELKQIQEFNIL